MRIVPVRGRGCGVNVGKRIYDDIGAKCNDGKAFSHQLAKNAIALVGGLWEYDDMDIPESTRQELSQV